MQIAAVYAKDGIRLLAAGASVTSINAQLAVYVTAQADFMLFPDDAASVRRLVEQGRHADAVAHYFERVGERWEKERLVLKCVEVCGPPDERRQLRSRTA